MAVPRWVRALLALDRAAERVRRAQTHVRDELLWAWVPVSRRQDVTDAIYADERMYSRGGALFELGLRAYEQALLAHPRLPRGGRVLIGGAGGGRELVALHRAGYAVTAFEPSAALVQQCERTAELLHGTRVLQGSYGDLVAAVGGAGPLVALREDAPYSLVWLGWRSLSHVLEPAQRRRLFAAIARLAPGAPVVLTFAPRASGGGTGAIRRALRRAFAHAGAPATAPEGAWFLPRAGFAVRLDREDLEAALGDDYEIVCFGTEPDGFTVASPR